MQHVYYVVVFIIRRQDHEHQLLLARRSAGQYMGGTWQLISGGLEPDETAWECALREMREETSLAPREFYRLSTLTSFYRPDNDSLNTAPMFCAVVANEDEVRINAEHAEFEWVNLNDAVARLMWPSDQQALAELRSVILGDGPAREHMRIPLPLTDPTGPESGSTRTD